jgi:hypothetical protein
VQCVLVGSHMAGKSGKSVQTATSRHLIWCMLHILSRSRLGDPLQLPCAACNDNAKALVALQISFIRRTLERVHAAAREIALRVIRTKVRTLRYSTCIHLQPACKRTAYIGPQCWTLLVTPWLCCCTGYSAAKSGSGGGSGVAGCGGWHQRAASDGRRGTALHLN